MSKRTEEMTRIYNEVSELLAPFAVGIDNLFEDARVLVNNTLGYPPYNVIRCDGQTIIEVALAGFTPQDIQIFVERNFLHVKYDRPVADIKEEVLTDIPHRGIATRSFDLQLRIVEGVVVKEAVMKNGLLTILMNKQLPETQRTLVDIRSE